MGKSDKKLTASEIAEKFKVGKGVVLGWLQRGKFPNAKKAVGTFGVSYWEIPASDLEGFEPQRRKGKPRLSEPSKAALAKRKSRSKSENSSNKKTATLEAFDEARLAQNKEDNEF